MTYEPSEKDLELKDIELERRILSGGMTDEEYDKDMEKVLGQVHPATIKTPEPTHLANTVADWLSDPVLMLVSLTETLNFLLRHCEYECWDVGDWKLEVIPEDFKNHNLLDIFVHLLFEQDAARLRIRNGIEPTPFSIDVIEAVEQTFRTCAREFENNKTTSPDTIDKFTDAVKRYKTELQILADWIEARAIFLDKKQPQKTRKKSSPNIEDDVREAMFAVWKAGKKPTKETVGDYIRKVMKKPIGNNRLNKELNELRRKMEKSGPY